MTDRPLDQLLNRAPDVIVTEDDAVAEGVIVRMDVWGIPTFHGEPVRTVSRPLFEALQARFMAAIELGALPPWAVLGDLLDLLTRPELVVSDATDERADWLYATAPLTLLDGRPVWLQRSGDGFTAMLPEDY
jgi:hypothetical protein